MDETVNNIEDITSKFVIIEYYNNNKIKIGGLVGACGRWTGNYYPICSGLIIVSYTQGRSSLGMRLGSPM